MNHRSVLTPLPVEIRSAIATLFLVLLTSAGLHGQTTTAGPDVVVFTNGEKLVGHFEGLVGGTAKFKSDTFGEITIDLSKVQELHTSQKFAVIEKNVKLGKNEKDARIPQGTIAVTNQTVQVDAGNGQPAQTLPVDNLSDIIDQAEFEQAFRHSGIFQKWKGAIIVGSSIVEATQNSVSFNTDVALVRAIPLEDWLAPRNRTAIDFSDSFGKVTQPGSPEVKTSIYHGDAERDEYFTSQIFGFGSVAFDHNFSQGLDLQQLYGGGVGWSTIHKKNETLDFKGSIDYEKQQFAIPVQNKNLLTSVFAEFYTLKFARGITLNEQLSASPAWTDTRAYSTYGSLGIVLPVYKRFGFSANVIDSFLNDPPPGFKKNSVQFTTGLSYTLP